MKKWLVAVRAPFFTASLAPVVVGVAVAFYEGVPLRWLHAILTLLGVTALHAGTNLANDYFDHRSRNDWVNATPTPFSGGSRVIQTGALSPRAVLIYALACFAVGAAIGLYLWRVTPGYTVLWLGLIGVCSGFFYTATPVAIGYRGVGELFIGLNFGVLATLGAHYVQAGHLSAAALSASLPVSFLIAAVVYINEFPDYAADKEVRKRTLVVLLGLKRARWGYWALMAATYVAVAAAVALKILPPWALLGMLTLPVAAQATNVLFKNYADPYKILPANGLTIIVHLATSLLVGAGMVIGKLA
jgi:1,4-dihydroxy-2-naphthoate octaprenyltransferase